MPLLNRSESAVGSLPVFDPLATSSLVIGVSVGEAVLTDNGK